MWNQRQVCSYNCLIIFGYSHTDNCNMICLCHQFYCNTHLSLGRFVTCSRCNVSANDQAVTSAKGWSVWWWRLQPHPVISLHSTSLLSGDQEFKGFCDCEDVRYPEFTRGLEDHALDYYTQTLPYQRRAERPYRQTDHLPKDGSNCLAMSENIASWVTGFIVKFIVFQCDSFGP